MARIGGGLDVRRADHAGRTAIVQRFECVLLLPNAIWLCRVLYTVQNPARAVAKVQTIDSHVFDLQPRVLEVHSKTELSVASTTQVIANEYSNRVLNCSNRREEVADLVDTAVRKGSATSSRL